MSNYLNFTQNPYSAYAADKAKSYVIASHTRPDPGKAPQTDPLTGKVIEPLPLVSKFQLDAVQYGVLSRLGQFDTLQQAQAAAQADANK